MKQGYVGENPASKILPIKVDRNEPEILTVEQSKALIKAAQHYKHGVLLPYIAIGLFAGLRPTELSRLDWQRIDLKDHTITLGADMAKMRAKRIIELSDNLVAWLTPLAQSKPQIVKANFRRDFTAVKKLAGWGPTTKEIPNRRPLPQDIMRHTAISNHLAFYQHEGKTAAWAGNSPDIIQRHYKGLIKQAESQEFWNIRPEC
jgi:integrase